ncbi:hypothetical protein [Streptomyces roseicoloratus]|uniref:Co-chaperone DjlA N-terminal domain-containing protein n=1 Tax=Streptomyces roseicoloratus TaxID=2508722 RepID=A0ABY9RQ07_9ACTN|nr:hypothetical protein [Streptomyces roseicoloratus]WMX44276.1 hypothetical protein RGF97_04615 [Streptomyces roseicoloratus]
MTDTTTSPSGSVTAELDFLGALLAFDFIGFAQKGGALDPADPDFGRAVGAGFGIAARRRFPQGASAEEVDGYVAGFLGSLEAGAEDFDAAYLAELIAAALRDTAPAVEHPDPRATVQARLVLTLRMVRELGLGPDEQRELLAEAAARLTAA